MLEFWRGWALYVLSNVVVFLIGYLFILWGVDSAGNVIKSSVLFSIGASLIASAIVMFLDIWRELGRENILKQSIAVISQAGLRNVYPKRDLDKYDDEMRDAQQVIEIAGYTLNAWYESYGSLVAQKADQQRDLQIRILLVDPNSDYALHRAALEEKSGASVRDSVQRIVKHFAAYPNIEVRFLKSWLSTMIFRIDNVMYVGPHFYRRPSKATLTMELASTGWLFQEFSNEFNRLWQECLPFAPETTVPVEKSDSKKQAE